MAYGELALRPSEFRLLTPREFIALYDGYLVRKSNQEEREARWVSMLMNATGNYKSAVTVESVLGRPLRANWANAVDKNPRLAEKDEARRKLNQRET